MSQNKTTQNNDDSEKTFPQNNYIVYVCVFMFINGYLFGILSVFFVIVVAAAAVVYSAECGTWVVSL